MRKLMIMLTAALSLSVGAAVAQAQGPWGWGDGGNDGGSSTPTAFVAGTVTCVVTPTASCGLTSPAPGSFVAEAYVLPGHHWGNGEWPGCAAGGQGGSSGQGGNPGQGNDSGQDSGSGSDHGGGSSGSNRNFASSWRGDSLPTPTQVTITTNSTTMFDVNGNDMATFGNLTAGMRFVAAFAGNPTDSLSSLVANPALSVRAHTRFNGQTLYAFVGTVTGTNTTNDTVTVTVTSSIPSGLFASPPDQTFQLGAGTLIFGSSGVETIGNVGKGDVVAGALLGPSGETAAQVETSPLQVLLDFPVPSSASPAVKSQIRAKALAHALKMLDIKRGAKHHRLHKHNKHKARRR